MINRNTIIVTYLLTLILAYFGFLLPEISHYLKYAYSLKTIFVSPFKNWLYAAVCGGCIQGSQYFALWVSIPFMLAAVTYMSKSIVTIRRIDYFIGEALLILLLAYPVWFGILRGFIFKAGFFSNYFSYCCE